ncbi:MAG: hypothetical protein FGM24_07095 [Candidatus Kapabacteria bacterium]|nr:hypothetical protein [Candidatus Kapabacteria bacterium]
MIILLTMAFWLMLSRKKSQATGQQRVQQVTIESLRDELQKEREMHSQSRQQLEELLVAHDQQVARQESKPSEELPETQQVHEEIMPTTIAYLTTPEADGSFDDRLRSERFQPGESIYVITFINPERTRAMFELILHQDALDLALRRRERLIEPYCDAENTPRGSISSIETLESGEVELSSGFWRVVRKARIRYQ